jgi:hypothetical protein
MKNYTLKIIDKKGKMVKCTTTTNRRRFLHQTREDLGQSDHFFAYLRVYYRPREINEGIYTTKRELLEALEMFDGE